MLNFSNHLGQRICGKKLFCERGKNEPHIVREHTTSPTSK